MNKKLIVFFLILFGFLIYSNSLSNNFVFCDHYLILENYLVRSFKFLVYYFKGYLTQSVTKVFRPLTMLSYSLNYLFHNYRILGYRIFNIFIHCLNAFLVYLILLRLFAPEHKKAGLVSALIYLTHPINNEVVNYIMARSDLLLTLFVLLYFYLGTILAKDFKPEAEYFLKKSIQIEPYFQEAYYNLGLLYLGLKDKRRATLYLNRAGNLGYEIPEAIKDIFEKL